MEALIAALALAAAILLAGAPGQRRRLRSLHRGGSDPEWWRAGMARLRGWRWIPGARRRRARRRAEALVAAAAFAAELRAGQPLRSALLRALPVVAPRAAAAAAWGGDIPSSLRQDARAQHLPLLSGVAACWEVSESSGAGLASALDRLAASERAAEEVRVQLAAQLAAPRATSRMLAALPVIGIVLGLALGGDPLGWLLGTGIGRMCLAAGIALTGLGLWWLQRIALGVERSL